MILGGTTKIATHILKDSFPQSKYLTDLDKFSTGFAVSSALIFLPTMIFALFQALKRER